MCSQPKNPVYTKLNVLLSCQKLPLSFHVYFALEIQDIQAKLGRPLYTEHNHVGTSIISVQIRVSPSLFQQNDFFWRLTF